MARRRRKIAAKTKRRSSSGLAFEVKTGVLREIWAVTHLALGIFTLLSLNNNFGLVGDFWMGVLRPILGWGANVLPFVFFLFSLLLFFSKRITFSLSRLTGIFLMTVSILGIFHMYVPIENSYSEAQAGHYGGYVGFVSNFLFGQVLNIGRIGSVAVFLTLALIGVLLTFQIPLSAFLAFFKPEIKLVRRRDYEDDSQIDVQEEEQEQEEEMTEEEEEEPSEEALEKLAKFAAEGEEEDGQIVTIKRAQISTTVSDDEKEKRA